MGWLRNQLPPSLGFFYLTLPFAVAIAALVALWRILGAFIFGGPRALLEVPRLWWSLLVAGSVFAMAAALYIAAEWLSLISSDSFALLIPMGTKAIGAILLIPLIHIGVEYWLAMRSNYRMERTCDS